MSSPLRNCSAGGRAIGLSGSPAVRVRKRRKSAATAHDDGSATKSLLEEKPLRELDLFLFRDSKRGLSHSPMTIAVEQRPLYNAWFLSEPACLQTATNPRARRQATRACWSRSPSAAAVIGFARAAYTPLRSAAVRARFCLKKRVATRGHVTVSGCGEKFQCRVASASTFSVRFTFIRGTRR